jgi:hypothetical protein
MMVAAPLLDKSRRSQDGGGFAMPDIPSIDRMKEISIPLRKLLAIAQYLHGVKREAIFAKFHHCQSKDITLINRLTDIDRHPASGTREPDVLIDLYNYVALHFFNPERLSHAFDDIALPLLRICFPDKLQRFSPYPFDFLSSNTVTASTETICDHYRGIYDYIRFSTSTEQPFKAAGLVRGALIIYGWKPRMTVPRYTLLYRGKPEFGPWYTSAMNGNICLTGNRLHFIAQEQFRHQLSYIIWPCKGLNTPSIQGNLPDSSFFRGAVIASDSGGQVFSAVALFRRISRDVPDPDGVAEVTALIRRLENENAIGIFQIPAALETQQWARDIMVLADDDCPELKYLDHANRQSFMLELGLT